MRLKVFTPLAIAIDEDGVRAVRAEDDSGSFGVLPGHVELLTSLTLSVVSWTGADGARRHCAVRRGTLHVLGEDVLVATRDAVPGTNLETLHADVLARFATDLETERHERVESARLHLAAIREIVRHLQPGRGAGAL